MIPLIWSVIVKWDESIKEESLGLVSYDSGGTKPNMFKQKSVVPYEIDKTNEQGKSQIADIDHDNNNENETESEAGGLYDNQNNENDETPGNIGVGNSVSNENDDVKQEESIGGKQGKSKDDKDEQGKNATALIGDNNNKGNKPEFGIEHNMHNDLYDTQHQDDGDTPGGIDVINSVSKEKENEQKRDMEINLSKDNQNNNNNNNNEEEENKQGKSKHHENHKPSQTSQKQKDMFENSQMQKTMIIMDSQV